MTSQPADTAAPKAAAHPPLLPPGQPHMVDSQDLLQGWPLLLIRHHGEVYRLQSTRQGKLILTK